jgi:hypothetical protein
VAITHLDPAREIGLMWSEGDAIESHQIDFELILTRCVATARDRLAFPAEI